MADKRLLTTSKRKTMTESSMTMAATANIKTTFLFMVAFIVSTANAYIPAIPTNDTSTLVAADDFIQINWLPMGTSAYKDALSRQLANTATPTVAGYRGALVHFVEANATAGSDAPWIALISCDDSTGTPSGPGATLQTDAVSLALRAGAETAILYSLESQTCVLDNAFVAGNNGTLDLYVTASQASAQSIIQQFMNASPETYWFNATALEASQASIQSEISSMGGVPTTATEPSLFGSTGSSSPAAAPTLGQNADGTSFNYLIATIANSGNSTNGTQITSQPQNNSGGGGGANTGLAMIILYAITGCVTLLFLIVIMSGAIRAMRHPERYGPRARNARPGDNGQSRIGGLSQAILDTFPVVKFLSGQNRNNQTATSNTARTSEDMTDDGTGRKDIETGIEDIDAGNNINRRGGEVTAASVPMVVLGASRPSVPTRESDIGEAEQAQSGTGSAAPVAAAASTSSEEPRTSTEDKPATQDDDEQVDTSVTCPICLVDFEDGDDLRVLPCDSRHQFHDACVVPWLLNVSSLCPLCRLDLAKDREAPGAEAEGSSSETPERPTTRPRASSVLATSFRQLLPTTGINNRASRQAAAPAATPVDSATNAEAGPSSSTPAAGELGQITSNTEEGQHQAGGGAMRSRWMRYVEQRRQRVRARTVTRRDQPQAGAPGSPAP